MAGVSTTAICPTLVAFDVETTGLWPDRANITELAAVKFTPDGAVIETFCSFANPGHPIPAKITRLTGIDDTMVAGARPSHEVISAWLEWLGPNALLIAHNAPFDIRFVHGTLLKCALPLRNYPVVDTLVWARRLCLPVADHSLEALLAHIGHRAERLHRAAHDALGVMALSLFLAGRDGMLQDAAACYGHFKALSVSSRRLCGSRFARSMALVSPRTGG